MSSQVWVGQITSLKEKKGRAAAKFLLLMMENKSSSSLVYQTWSLLLFHTSLYLILFCWTEKSAPSKLLMYLFFKRSVCLSHVLLLLNGKSTCGYCTCTCTVQTFFTWLRQENNTPQTFQGFIVKDFCFGSNGLFTSEWTLLWLDMREGYREAFTVVCIVDKTWDQYILLYIHGRQWW